LNSAEGPPKGYWEEYFRESRTLKGRVRAWFYMRYKHLRYVLFTSREQKAADRAEDLERINRIRAFIGKSPWVPPPTTWERVADFFRLR